MNHPRITLLWRRLHPYETGKDVLLVPYYLAKELDGSADIVCNPSDVDGVPERMRDRVRLVRRPMSRKWAFRLPVNFSYLLSHSKKTDILMLFHWRAESLLSILTYKAINPQGKVYVKMDSINGREFTFGTAGSLRQKLRKRIYLHCLEKTDIISCENSEVFGKVYSYAKERAVYMPNGFDEEYLEGLNLGSIEKEKLILTVGRLGTEQKNTQMLLDAVSGMDLKEWRIALIGNTVEGFPEVLENFKQSNPQLKEKIFITGPILDKKELWAYYAKARAFVLTSRWESYGLVLEEAARFADYIITTPVGAARSILNRFPGEIINNSSELRTVIERLIDNTIPACQDPDSETVNAISWSSRIKPLSDALR